MLWTHLHSVYRFFFPPFKWWFNLLQNVRPPPGNLIGAVNFQLSVQSQSTFNTKRCKTLCDRSQANLWSSTLEPKQAISSLKFRRNNRCNYRVWISVSALKCKDLESHSHHYKKKKAEEIKNPQLFLDFLIKELRSQGKPPP